MKYVDNEGNICEDVGCCLKCNEDTRGDNFLCDLCINQEIEERELEEALKLKESFFYYKDRLADLKEELEAIRLLSFEYEKYVSILHIAEYMIERIEFHKVQYDKYEDDETKNHINLLFKDIKSLFDNSRWIDVLDF